MSSVASPGPQVADAEAAPAAAAILGALDQVLSSPHFRNSLQCRKLLTYVVTHTLAREEHLLRERVIGADVFGRPVDYEASQDPVVRLRAAEVRKRLAQYYQSTQEPFSVCIEIPSGGYRATFRLTEEPSRPGRQEDDPPPAALLPAEHAIENPSVGKLPVGTLDISTETLEPAAIPTPLRLSGPALAGRVIAAALLVLAIAAGAWFRRAPDDSALRAFWAPWTSGPRQVLIAIGSNAVYRLSGSLTDRYAATHGLESQGADFYVPFAPGESIPASDLTPGYNSFVALGDVSAVSNIIATLTRQGKNFQERFPSDYSFAELRSTPSILIGGFNNPMTLELTRHLEFVLRRRNEIDDTASPGRRWVLNAPWDSRYTEDYAIVTRLNRRGDAPLLSVAGLGQYGTIAAAEFVCDPQAIRALSHSLPKGWAAKNLQIVLHTRVVDFRAASTEVVALRSW